MRAEGSPPLFADIPFADFPFPSAGNARTTALPSEIVLMRMILFFLLF